MIQLPPKEYMKFLVKHWRYTIPLCIALISLVWTIATLFYREQAEVSRAEISLLQSQLNQREVELNALKNALDKSQQEVLALGQQTLPSTPTDALQNALLTGDVPFEWQWAGENWYGRVILGNRDGQNVVTQARVGQIEKVIQANASDVIRMNGRILELLKGSFEVVDANSIEIHMLVDKINRRTNATERQTIDGILKPVSCYAGTVTYTTDEGSFEGDMTLVASISSSVGNVVNDWFRENNPLWVSYKQ